MVSLCVALGTELVVILKTVQAVLKNPAETSSALPETGFVGLVLPISRTVTFSAVIALPVVPWVHLKEASVH